MADNKEHIDLSIETYGNIKDISYSFAVLPWGATEPHNYHLPYLTDCYLAHDIAVDATAKAWDKFGAKGMVLPPIPLGAQNPGQREQPFCLHARYETQKCVLTDIVESLNYQGIHILVIMNGHGGNSFKQMIRDLAVDYPQMTIASCDWFTVEPQDGYFENKDDHAGEMETSVMMHYHPGLVNLAMAGDGESKPFNIDSLNAKVAWIPRNWSKVSVDTGIGNPKKSSAEKGKRFADVVTDKIAKLFDELVNKSIY
ncbi:creatininase family protein [Dysgonomonas sp. 521]|uniref:creatininase family protein n=1 Tax=Dysgonomonas sp. 521 TaxID=2302932 RepID=UPI0013D8CE29|nr:creatininase family protein [Dysgonomonas sp. 521]NDV94537.1 creatininase family protein [Dysgonomonas sp. 521]